MQAIRPAFSLAKRNCCLRCQAEAATRRAIGLPATGYRLPATVPASYVHVPMKFELLATDGAARRGRLTFERGTIETPVFMPVGTYGSVKAMTPASLLDV